MHEIFHSRNMQKQKQSNNCIGCKKSVQIFDSKELKQLYQHLQVHQQLLQKQKCWHCTLHSFDGWHVK